MPPTRTMPPAKAVKTERTHEENQERAYIAASRRSDRSLEARVESARRASEIHKRRTGRSLRVTEQDVQNEEMYEEEDDDLPLQYRRLTAHLQTGSADFNRRLSAYLTNHVAMRSALEQSIHQSYAQQFPNAQQYPQGMFPSPMIAHQQQQGMMQPPNQNYRQHPYSLPQQQQQGFTLPHQRANSVAVPQQSQTSTPTSPAMPPNQRRSTSMSLPASDSLTPSNDPRSPQTPGSGQQIKPSFPPGSFAQNQQAQQQLALPSYDMGAFGQTTFPFSTQLPGESQGFLNNTLNSSDPLTNMMMAGSDSSMLWNFNNQNQNYGMAPQDFTNSKMQQQQYFGGPQNAPSVAGLNSTLAPPSSMEPSKPARPVERINLDDEVSPTSADSDDATFGDDNTDNNLFFENAMLNKDGNTPGLNGDSWDSWIHDNSWGDLPAPSQ